MNLSIGKEVAAMKRMPIERLQQEDVVCHESLGGLRKHYERKAA